MTFELSGRPVEIQYGVSLVDTAGNAAHAATYIWRRLIVLDAELPGDPVLHNRILMHELFHFAWVRLGNGRRFQWESLLRLEWAARARGEAGWSSEWRRRKLSAGDVVQRARRWREYCCESFCDTGAWICTGDDSEVTLAVRWRQKRKSWFLLYLEAGNLPI